MPGEPEYFANAAALARWFERNAARADVLDLGFMKTGSGCDSVSWREAVDEALCVGWIDGVRHRIDDERYRIRFTPRKRGSNWSAANIKRASELVAEGRMKSAGLAALAERTEARSRTASYEQAAEPRFNPSEARQFKGAPGAWAFYQALPASYQRKLTWWIVSAKQASTRSGRLSRFIEACAQGKRL